MSAGELIYPAVETDGPLTVPLDTPDFSGYALVVIVAADENTSAVSVTAGGVQLAAVVPGDARSFVASGGGWVAIDSTDSANTRSFVDHTDSDDILAGTDLNAILLVGDTSTLTIPAEADDDLGAGFTCDLLHSISGTATIIPDTDVTLNGGTDSYTVDTDKAATLVKLPGTDAWWLFGAITVVT